ncbi:Uncharacterized protein SCF082_LOCUS10105, partial [Durusdinium trenchii]
EDDLCRGCRSVRRIRDFFCGGFLLRSQEARAVAALRTCVGELTDLAEIASPILEKEKAEADPAEDKSKDLSGKPSAPEVGGGPEAPVVKTEAVEKDENATETPGVSEVVDKEEDTQGEKKEEKKKKRKKKHPDQKPSKRRLEKKEKKARERDAQIAEDKKESLLTIRLGEETNVAGIETIVDDKDPVRAVDRGGAPGALARWTAGEEIKVSEIPIEHVGVGTMIEVTDGSYFGSPCKAAGQLQSIDVQLDAVHFRLKLTGTTNEELLKHQTGSPSQLVRVHRCPSDCAADRMGEDLLHAFKMRKLGLAHPEEGWARNLVVVAADDELGALRSRGEALAPVDPGREGVVEKKDDKAKKAERSPSKRRKKDKDKKKSKRSKKKKKESGRSVSTEGRGRKKAKEEEAKKRRRSSTSSSRSVQLTGKYPRAASTKSYDALYSGTGLDKKERIRRRVLKKAKRAARKKTKEKSSDGSDSSSDQSGSDLEAEAEDTLFEGETKVQRIAQRGSLEPIALMYMRQHLVKKANGPALREILTLSIAVDQLLNSRPARALDTLLQRLKSVEAGLNGAHWSVAQKLEVGPTENLMLTAQEELSSAQKEAYTDARTKMLAGLSEGRPKGYAKGSSKSKDDGRRDRDRPKGKDSGKGKSKSSNKEEQAALNFGWVSGARDRPGEAEIALGGPFGQLTHTPQAVVDQPVDEAPLLEADGCNTFPPMPPPFVCEVGTAKASDLVMSDAKKERLGSELEGRSIGELGGWVVQRFLEVVPLRSMFTGKGGNRDIFPLPTSFDFLGSLWPSRCRNQIDWMVCMTTALNSFWGEELFGKDEASEIQIKVLNNLLEEVERFCNM